MIDLKNTKVLYFNKNKISSLILAVLPVFSSYAIGYINVNLILSMYALILAVIYGKIKLEYSICLLWFSHIILSSISSFFSYSSSGILNSILIGTYIIVCINILWNNCTYRDFVRYARYVGMLSSVFIIIQSSLLSVGIEPPNGMIAGLQLGKYISWGPTWGFRPHSFFSEPSYYAIYILPLLLFSINNRKYFESILYCVGLVISTSSLGIIGMLIVIVYCYIKNRGRILSLVVFILLLITVHIILIKNLNYYNVIIDRSIEKILNLNEQSGIRIRGYIDYFPELPFINKLFGVGIGQLSNFFNYYFGINAHNYSNAFVYTLICTGLIGFIAFIIFIIYVLKRYKEYDYMLIFILICAVDAFMYNYFFYYVLSFVFLKMKKKL